MELLTVPFIVMVISGILWYVMAHRRGDAASDPWLLDVCRGVFFISALVVLWAYMGKPLLNR